MNKENKIQNAVVETIKTCQESMETSTQDIRESLRCLHNIQLSMHELGGHLTALLNENVIAFEEIDDAQIDEDGAIYYVKAKYFYVKSITNRINTKQDKIDLLENIKENTAWFNSKDRAIFKSILKDITNK